MHQATDMNNNSSTVLMDPMQQYITASASFARRDQIAYTGCEFNEYYMSANSSYTNKLWEGNVRLGSGNIVYDPNKAHTGDYSLLVPSSQEGFTYTFTPETGGKYKASVWLYLPGTAEGVGDDQYTNARLIYRVKGTNTILNKVGEGYRSTTRKARSSYLLDITIDAAQLTKNPDGITYPQIEVVCVSNGADRSIYFDDFRCSPLESNMTSYVYNLDLGLMTHILDADNFYTRFEYDAMGKLTATYREIFRVAEKKVMEQRVNYSNK
jgi:YD repeat-containing protein